MATSRLCNDLMGNITTSPSQSEAVSQTFSEVDLPVINGIKLLKEALQTSEMLNSEQQHQEAAILLRRCIGESNSDWHPRMSEELLLQYRELVQECAREEEHQLYRQAKLNSYLA